MGDGRPSGLHFMTVLMVDRTGGRNTPGLSSEEREDFLKPMRKQWLWVSKEYCHMYQSAQMPMVQVTFVPSDPNPSDLRCIICRTQSDSVVARVAPGGGRLGTGGTTAVGSGRDRRGARLRSLSEIYWDAADSYEFLAKLTFHELMHNKLQLQDDLLHNSYDAGYGLSRDQLATTDMTNRSTSEMTQGNAVIMAQHLFDENPQFAGG